MSSYWDAVARAALGLPGSAVPRPRSLFEPDGVAASGGLQIADEEVEATSPPAASAADREPQVMLQADRGRERTEPDRHPAVSTERQPTVESDSVTVDRRVPEPDHTTATPIGARLTPPEPPPPLERSHEETVEHHEIRRIDSSRTTVESAPSARHDDSTPSAQMELAPPLPAPPEPEPESSVELVTAQPVDDRPMAVVAEPIATRAEPAPAVVSAPERPPLIIEIEHIDIRIEPAATPAPSGPHRRDPHPALSLVDYLTGRRERR